MKHHYLEQYAATDRPTAAHWAANTNGYGEVLLQLCDDTATEVRLRLTPYQAEEIGAQMKKLARAARTEPPFEQAQLLAKMKAAAADWPADKPEIGTNWASPIRRKDRQPRGTAVKTTSETFFPILGCLKAAEKFLKDTRLRDKVSWTPFNGMQTAFCTDFLPHLPEVDLLGKNLEYRADLCAAVINQWLHERGFDIRLSEGPSGSFCVASILDVLVEWAKKGVKTEVTSDDTEKEYPAVEIKEGLTVFEDKRVHPWPIIRLDTKSSDKVFMTVYGDLPACLGGGFPIADKIRVLQAALRGRPTCDYGKAIFPMVDYNERVDISWIVRLSTGSSAEDFYVHEAVQQTKFRMNEIGARAESAVGMEFGCLCAHTRKPDVVIDRPFLLWIERPGITMPLFSAVFAEDTWKRPKGL